MPYLISYDNESYEDHQVMLLCIVPTKKRAEAKIAAWMAWADKERAKLSAYPEYSMSEEDYDRGAIAYSNAVKAIKPPHGLSELTGLIGSDTLNQGHLRFVKLPVLK